MTTSQTIQVGSGRIAYDDTGGPGRIVLCVPGLGDVRGLYRFLTPKLAADGYRVVTADLRGHGESSVGWPSYTQADLAADMIAVLTHLDARDAIVVGGSVAGGSAYLAAALAPDRIGAAVGIGPATRDIPLSPPLRAIVWLIMRSPRLWDLYYGSLYKAVKPADLKAYRKALIRNLREPGRYAAARELIHTPKGGVRTRFADVHCPTLVVMGSKDPDFPDPPAEAAEIAGALHGRAEIVAGAGHYPQVEYPEQVCAAIAGLLGP